MKNLLVVGGTGFLGKHICAAALAAGWSVTSLSRSGRLKNIDGVPVSVISQINWKQANVFDPDSYKHELESSDAVVHTMGTIFASPTYKSIMDKPVSVCDLVKTGARALYGSNPMDKSATSSTSDQFDRLNKQSAVGLATAFAAAHMASSNGSTSVNGSDTTTTTHTKLPFVYISADDWNPLVDRRYVGSKYEAETVLSMIPTLRSVFLRPGFMYNDQGPASVSLRQAVRIGAGAAALLGLPNKTVSVQTVAQAAVEALDDSSIEGVVSLDALQKFASMSS